MQPMYRYTLTIAASNAHTKIKHTNTSIDGARAVQTIELINAML